jgi:hypothetical protein
MNNLDIYISFWGFSDFDVNNPDERISNIVDMTALSFSCARRHYENIYLVTDSNTLPLFDDIPFTAIYTDLDELHDLDPKYHRYWSLGKIKTIQVATEVGRPFVQIDYDVFLQKPLPEWLVSSRAFAQSPEPVAHTFAYNLDLFYETYDHLGPCVHRSENAFNCGIIGGTDIEFFKKYADGVIDFIKHPSNSKAFDLKLSSSKKAAEYSYLVFTQYRMIPDEVPGFQFAIWSEQYYLACLAIQENVEVELLFKSHSDDYNAAVAAEYGYIHLLDGKNNPEMMSTVIENANVARFNGYRF